MQKFVAADPDFELKVRASFARQQLMNTINARLKKVAAGEVRIEIPFDSAFTQQNGFLHAAIVTGIVDTACGYAAYTLMPASAGVLSVEFKVNFLNPAQGEKFLAIGKVVKSGRTLTICTGEVLAFKNSSEEKLIAVMQATMMTMKD